MNKENIDKAIAIMERAQKQGSVRMYSFQTSYGQRKVETEEELHACGNKACLAGHIAVSPEWLETPGNMMNWIGAPISVNYQLAECSIGEWFNVKASTVERFIYSTGKNDDMGIYGVPWGDVKAEHVIRELTLLKDLGEDAYRAYRGI